MSNMKVKQDAIGDLLVRVQAGTPISIDNIDDAVNALCNYQQKAESLASAQARIEELEAALRDAIPFVGWMGDGALDVARQARRALEGGEK